MLFHVKISIPFIITSLVLIEENTWTIFSTENKISQEVDIEHLRPALSGYSVALGRKGCLDASFQSAPDYPTCLRWEVPLSFRNILEAPLAKSHYCLLSLNGLVSFRTPEKVHSPFREPWSLCPTTLQWLARSSSLPD